MPDEVSEVPAAPAAVKCACTTCHCMIKAGQGVEHNGKLYCSKPCAYDCTEQTCVCVHERCDKEGHGH